jgi:hypothetical protein
VSRGTNLRVRDGRRFERAAEITGRHSPSVSGTNLHRQAQGCHGAQRLSSQRLPKLHCPTLRTPLLLPSRLLGGIFASPSFP